MGVLPICWVTVSITTGGTLGCVRVDMVDVVGEVEELGEDEDWEICSNYLASWRIHASSIALVVKVL